MISDILSCPTQILIIISPSVQLHFLKQMPIIIQLDQMIIFLVQSSSCAKPYLAAISVSFCRCLKYSYRLLSSYLFGFASDQPSALALSSSACSILK